MSAKRLAGIMGFELLLLGLLILTVVAFLFQGALLDRTLAIMPDPAGRYVPHARADAVEGGTSGISIDRQQPSSWSCRLTRAYQYRFCSYELAIDRTGRGHGVDLTHFSAMRIVLDYAGPAETVRIYLRNFDPRYSKPGQVDSTKFNMAEVPVQRGRNVIDLQPSDLRPAEWWIAKFKMPRELSQPQFDNVVAIQVQSGTYAPVGRYRMRLDRITLSSKRITIGAWYATIVGIWALLIGAYLVHRIVQLSRDLDRRRASQAAALRLVRHAEESARRDYLTQLLNRTGIMNAYLDINAMSGDGARLAVILLDVDHFKQVNDRCGHVVGDTVLTGVADVLTANTRANDIVGRWGGEEFVVICHAGGADAAMTAAETLRRAIADHPFPGCGPVTASLGVFCCTGAGQELEVAIARADGALYRAKAQGRNCVVNYDAVKENMGLRARDG
ncbi:GGDEF domain-containing protein [uncultured Sphingomonas sp.]|uniref:GGDEF domain-containing protein n=1 Tax=uncultured Sphingomonas sp. TaxID=158754 RepID=UPI0025F3F2A0|nr:GGDEF domain-containing protein [uncultured Sphingomonas sp.]